MLVDQPEAPPRSDRRLFAVAVGCLLLAAAPAILSAFDQAIDRSLHLSDLWPDFWSLLDQIGPWWIGGAVLGAAFIAGRALLTKLPGSSVGYLVAAAVWWLLLAIAPFLLIGLVAVFRINHWLGNPDVGSGARELTGDFAAAWVFGVVLVAVFAGGRRLRARPKAVWHVVGTIVCGLAVAAGPAMLLAILERVYTHLYHAAFPPDVRRLANLITGCWLVGVALFGAVMGARRILISYAKPQSALRLMIVASGCVLLAFVPPFLIGMVVEISGRARDADLRQELVDPLAILSFGLMMLLTAIWQGRDAGDGDVRAGLGDAPVANYVPVTALAVAGVVYAALVRTVFHNAPHGLTSVLLIVPDRPAHNLYVFFVGVCLAPLSEELFLRGWMWTGLRRTWSVRSTAMLTGGIWLVAHLANGIGAPVVLLPLAIILSAARHVGQSVRASLAIHASYNLMILLLY